MLSNNVQHFEISRSQLRELATTCNLEYKKMAVETASVLIVESYASFGYARSAVYIEVWWDDHTPIPQPLDEIVDEFLQEDIDDIKSGLFASGHEYEVWHVIDGKTDWLPIVYMTEDVLYQANVETLVQSLTSDDLFYDCELARADNFTEFMSAVYAINPFCAIELDYSVPTVPFTVAWEWESVWCDIYTYDMFPRVSRKYAFERSRTLFSKLEFIPVRDHYVGETLK